MAEGSLPDRNEKRDGAQSGLAQYAESNTTPCFASAIEIRRLRQMMAVCGKRERRHLISHQNKDILFRLSIGARLE